MEGWGEKPEGCRKDRPVWSFADVEARLVEAFGFMRRLPDRERAWQRAGTMSLWRQASSTLGMTAIDRVGYMLADRDQSPRLPGLTSAQVSRMEEALGWVDWVRVEDRPVMGQALSQLAAGKSRVSWGDVMAGLGLVRGKDGLRMRYSRAITAIARRLEAGATKGEGASSRFNACGENIACSPSR